MKWVLRTSSVRVADEQGERLYRSLEDVPPEMRDKIVESLNGEDSQTILIANQKAYDRIAEGGDELPEELRRLKPALLRHREGVETESTRPDGNWRRLLAGGVALIVLLWAMWIWALQSGT
jgi:hypothetical protein